MNAKYAVWALLLAVTLAVGCGKSAAPDKVPPQGDTNAPVSQVTVGDANESGDAQAAADNKPVVIGDAATDEAKKNDDLPEIVAKVNDEVITGKQFARQLDTQEKMMQQRGMPVSLNAAQRREMLDSVIDEKILGQMAKQGGFTTTDEEVKAEFDKARAKMPSDDYYKQYLASQGMTEDELMGLIRDKLTNQKFMDEKTKDLAVSDDELNAEYEKLKAAGHLERPETTTDVAHILVKVDGTDDAAWVAGKEKIDKARARIVGGETFANVAKEVSDDPGSKDRGGAYPDTPKGKMVPEFDEKMASTKVGEISEPFKTKFGWHILTVTGTHEAGTITLAEIKDDFSKYMLSKKRYDALTQIVKDARPSMKVEVFLKDEAPAAPAAPEAAPAAPAEAAPAAPAEAAPAAPAEAAPAAPAAPAEEAKPAGA